MSIDSKNTQGLWMLTGQPENSSQEISATIHEFGAPGSTYPLEPVLGFIRKRMKDLSPGSQTKIIKSARFYLPQGEYIKALIDDPNALRRDFIRFYPAEFRFEQLRWFSSLARLADLLSHPGETWKWLNGQNINPGLVRFLLAFSRLKGQRNLRISLYLSAYRNWHLPKSRDPWFTLVQEMDTAGRYIRPAGAALAHPREETIQCDNPKLYMESALKFHCYDDVLGLGEEWSDNYPGLWGELLLVSDFPDKAAVFLQQAWEDASQRKRTLADLETGLAYCRVLSAKKDVISCQRVLQVLTQEASRRGDPFLIRQVELHQTHIEILMNWSFKTTDQYRKLREYFVDQNLMNTVSYMDSNMSIYTWMIHQGHWSKAVQMAKEALERCRDQGNLFRVSVMYHVLGYIHEFKGDPDVALPYFQKSIKMRQSLGDTGELIKVLNGTGYFCFTVGRFSLALTYYGRALGLLKDIHDYTESCLTIFNMALISVFSGMHPDALVILETLLEVMDTLKMEYLPWHRRSKLQALAAISAYHCGRYSLAYEYLESIREEDIDEEAIPFVALARGVLDQGNHWFHKALENAQGPNKRHLNLRIRVEQILYSSTHLKGFDKAAPLEEILKSIEDRGDDLEARWIRLQKGPGSKNSPIGLKQETMILISGLQMTAQQEAANNQFREKIREINFLKNFQTQVHESLGDRAFQDKVKEQLRLGFSLESVQFRQISNPQKQSEGIYLDFPLEDQKILRLSAKAMEETPFTPEDVRIFELASSHMKLVWNLKKAREELERASSLDTLTGALTRREFLTRLEAEHRRVQRYSKERSGGYSILFLDLDNFKTYNDTLGHDAGDWVLRRFCRLIKSAIREIDILGRYGGDEFLILLPETTVPGVITLGHRILQLLKESKGFEEELTLFLGHSPGLSQEKWLGCSMGAAMYSTDNPTDTAHLIKMADSRLYLAKKQGKNCLVYADS